MSHFGDRLEEARRRTGSVAVIGIDPRLDLLPPALISDALLDTDGLALALERFGVGIVDAVAERVAAVKPNIAFFEAHGLAGLRAYNTICDHARETGLLVIGDVKRGDIGSTAEAYAQGLLGESDHPAPLGPHDALTLNPYLGTDSVKPFVESCRGTGRGLFVLVKTSNPSSAELQDLELKSGGTVADAVARLVAGWGEGGIGACGLSDVGAVVGATHAEELATYRAWMPKAPLLLPGYGAQGGTAADVVDAFREDGSGALVNASRTVIFAWKQEKTDDWQGAARRAAERMNEDLRGALQQAGRWQD